jgi:hypothetical protein
MLRERSPLYLMNSKLNVPQSQSGGFEEEKNLVSTRK